MSVFRCRLIVSFGCPPRSDQAVQFQQLESGVMQLHKHRFLWPGYREWEKIAYRISVHQPGPGANPKLKLKPSISNSHTRLIMQRAFSEFEHLAWEELKTQGLSGARVFIVDPGHSRGPHNCELPKLLKIGPADDIEQEANIFDLVRGTIPFNYRPNFVQSRMISCRDQAAVVQDFVEPAIPLATALGHGGASILAASLFDGALGNWRRASVQASDGYLCDSISRRIVAGVTKAKPTLQNAMAEAGLLKTAWPDVRHLRSIPYQSCRIHGDLHAGNVFVGTTSGDCILIDFTKSQIKPAALDPAALEIHLVFTAKKTKVKADTLYQWPIDLPKLSRDWLPNAVRAIRIFGVSAERDNRVYGFALVDQLLRFASFPQPALVARARAVSISFRLLEALAATPSL
jgi:hypothetical protein